MRNTLELRAMAMQRLGKQCVELTRVTERFGERTVLDNVDWIIGPGDRIGVLGENGAGKTTLLKIIQGAIKPTSGFVKIGKTVKFAVLSQRLDELEGNEQIPCDRGVVALSHARSARRQGDHAGKAS